MLKRIEGLRRCLPSGFGAAIVQDIDNRFYMTGYRTSAGFVVVLQDKVYFLTDMRYAEAAKKALPYAEFVLMTNGTAQVAQILEKNKIKKALIEDIISHASAKNMMSALSGVQVDDGETLSFALKQQRMIKDEQETECIEQAQRIADEAFLQCIKLIKPGMTERELKFNLETLIRKGGADDISFDSIVVAGENSSLPHGEAGDRPLKVGDLVTMDFGAKYKGYCTDITRTIAIGSVSDRQRAVYDTVLKAQLAAVAALKPGKTGKEVDKVARDIIDATEFKGAFGHGLGHSLGVQIHEDPRLSPKDSTEVCAGMVLTVEPGIYLEGEVGVRIEDTCVVTEDGCRPRSKISKELIIV